MTLETVPVQDFRKLCLSRFLPRHFPTRRQRDRQNSVEQHADAAEEHVSNQVQAVATETGSRTVEAVGCVTGLACSEDD